MGWDLDISPGIERAYYGKEVKPKKTRKGLPYLIAPRDNCITHAVLGIDQTGKSLSVAGFECPLVLPKTPIYLRHLAVQPCLK